MLFNSLIFILFGAGFFIVWPLFKKQNNIRWLYLVIASFIFYGWWDWRFLFLIIGSGLIDYTAGLLMKKFPTKKKSLLIYSVIANVGSLASFKYSGFIAENIEAIGRLAGLDLHIKEAVPDFMLITPIGISFYTFQSMSYTIDVYRDKIEPTKNIFHFFAYLSLFPQLVAGPIVRAKDFLYQLVGTPQSTEQQRYDGLRLIVHGFFKKVVIADTIAPVVNEAFKAGTLEPSTIYWWVIMTMFGIQVYCDFSGYSDIARGLAKWMGYEFNLNFNHPYTSKSLREFWSKWHISLSSWFFDYVYIPLGGSKVGELKEYRNIWITMFVSGFWHGAAWTYVGWGVCQAFFITFERKTGWIYKLNKIFGGKALATTFVNIQVIISYVFFRSESFTQVFEIIKNMLSFNFTSFPISNELLFVKAAIVTAIGLAREFYFWGEWDKVKIGSENFRFRVDQLIIAGMIFACIFLRGPGSTFIYFQF